MPERIAFRMNLNPGQADEYKRRHDNLWPEMVAALHEAGVSDYSIWLDPSVLDVEQVDYQALFNINREATVKVIRKALAGEPTIDWLLEHQETVEHFFHKLGVDVQL